MAFGTTNSLGSCPEVGEKRNFIVGEEILLWEHRRIRFAKQNLKIRLRTYKQFRWHLAQSKLDKLIALCPKLNQTHAIKKNRMAMFNQL